MISVSKPMIFLLGLSVAGFGCTRKPESAVVNPVGTDDLDRKDPTEKSRPGDDKYRPLGNEDGGTAGVFVSLDGAQMQRQNPTFTALGEITYQFKYADVSRNGVIQFINGRGQLTIDKLPTGKSDVIYFEILEDGTKKFEGKSDEAVTLSAGANSVKINLTAVQPGQPQNPQQGADLNLELEYNDPQNPSPQQNPDLQPGNPGTPPSPEQNPNLSPSIANWDGTDDLVIGNVWKIIDVN